MTTDPTQWAQRLGLAVNQLFARGANPNGEHYAMLDGRRASFALSDARAPDLSSDVSCNWQWSADLSHHVIVTEGEVHVRSGRDPLVRKFQRASVEGQLEEFLNFLDTSRRSALPDVVPFLIQQFRAVWANGGYEDGEIALAAFLFALYAAGEPEVEVITSPEWRKAIASQIGLETLQDAGLAGQLLTDAQNLKHTAPFGLKIIPSLVLRHVSGRLFQEAHALLESVQFGLFGSATITTSPTFSPAGAYFTPVPIARVLAEWAIQERSPLPENLTIGDFACGSGIFLTEAVRTLERIGFQGRVRIVGRDKSAQAVTMAKVAIRAALPDTATMTVQLDILQADALDSEWPTADIILMNPPFRSWERMIAREREWVHASTNRVGRPDLSVGFIQRGVESLKSGGVLGTLLPAGVLASHTLSSWRTDLLSRATPTLIAVLGEHDLFQHALVNVGMLALKADDLELKQTIRVAWSSAETGSASKAIRAIRRSMLNHVASSAPGAADWSIASTTLMALRQRPSWLPGAGALGPLLEWLNQTTGAQVQDLFTVRQGIRTGANDVFVQPANVISTLPEAEQRFFRKAVDAGSFVQGEIQPKNYLFVPAPNWKSESDVQEAVPQFFRIYLQPRRDSLVRRKRKSKDNTRWWELTWPRSWAFDGRSRLVSKRFGLYPAFARDFEGQLAVVQANAWIPTPLLTGGKPSDGQLKSLLTAYWWLLNSRVAVTLFREYCPNVAGGQLDLEHKYVRHVPLPDLGSRLMSNPALQLIATSIRSQYSDKLPPLLDRDRFAAAAYGTDVSEWNFAGLESRP